MEEGFGLLFVTVVVVPLGVVEVEIPRKHYRTSLGRPF